jgi:hypothetical protein
MKIVGEKPYEANKCYLFQYHHMGSWWVLEMYASDEDDARDRVNKLPHAQLLGERMGAIPALGGAGGILVRLICWWKNLRGKSA